MNKVKRAKPSPALIVAVVALVAGLAGTAVGGVVVNGLNKKQSKQVKRIAKKQGKIQGKKQARKQIGKRFPVQSSQIADAAVAESKIAAGAVDSSKIADAAVGGNKIAAGSVDASKLADLDLFGGSFTRANVADRTVEEFFVALDSAPKVSLFNKGQLSVYGRCFETDSGESYATAFVGSSEPGAILGATDTTDPEPTPPGSFSPFSTRTAWLDGDPEFLDPSTAEVDKMVVLASVGAGSFQSDNLSRASYSAMSPDGTVINGLLTAAIGSGGVYGDGAACLFGGFGVG